MVWVIAKTSFDHNGKKKRGDQFEVSQAYADQLLRRRLVTLDGEGPKSNDGQPSSVSPAAPVSTTETPPPSANGDLVTQAPPLPPTVESPPPLPVPPLPVVPTEKPKTGRKPKPKA